MNQPYEDDPVAKLLMLPHKDLETMAQPAHSTVLDAHEMRIRCDRAAVELACILTSRKRRRKPLPDDREISKLIFRNILNG